MEEKQEKRARLTLGKPLPDEVSALLSTEKLEEELCSPPRNHCNRATAVDERGRWRPAAQS